MKEFAIFMWCAIILIINVCLLGVFIAELDNGYGITKTVKYILCFLGFEFAVLTLYCFW